MHFDETLNRLNIGLPDLPGEDVQYRMSPFNRPRLSDSGIDVSKARQSAVIMLIYPIEGVAHTVFIVRPRYIGIHSGQVAFPGGRFEPKDADLCNTALRECHEEIGIPDYSIRILGPLTPLYIFPSKYYVLPWVGYLDKKPEFVADSKEVAQILTPSLSEIYAPESRGIFSVQTSPGQSRLKAPGYQVQEHIIWGATAMMLSEVEAILNPNAA